MKYKLPGRKDIAPFEAPCTKTAYNSKEDAEDIISHILQTRVTREIKAYKCDICGLWHLTSRGDNRGRRNRDFPDSR